MQNQLIWQLKKFDELSTKEVYEILRLRSEVFVVEQACVFLDMDNLDFDSHHLQGRVDGNLVAYVRILPPGLAYAEPSIGRVITSPAHRKVGAGIELMEKAVEKTISLHGKVPIMIGAQLYLKKFYEKFGFCKCSDVYMEDGIEHIKMIREV